MNQTRKIIVSAIIGIMAWMGLYTTTNAYFVGQALNISYTTYKNDGNIYCVEHGQKLKSSNDYTIISNVKIKGNQSTDHAGNVQNSWYNAKLAYILSADNGAVKSDGPVANSIWNNMYTWMNQVGQHHAGLYLGFASTKTGSASPLDAESDNYANSLKDTTDKMTDNTNKDNIKISSYKKDNKFYIKVGPFNWTFPGNMKNVTVNDQDNKAISGVLYSSFNGNDEYWYGANEIQSGKDFYVSLPASTDITEITTITAEASMNVKTVNLWFLEAKAGYKQNLIIREPSEEPLEILESFKYNIKIRRNLTIVKVNAKDEKIKLGGVGFYIQHKETGKYVRKDSKGNISYVNYVDYTKEENKNKKGQTEFVTKRTGKNKGKITIKGLLPGTYIAYETKNPNYGYEMEDGLEIKIDVNENNTWKIPNTQKYIKLSGYVWEDISYLAKEKNKTNGLYKDEKEDVNDRLFDGITVRVKEVETGEIAKNKDGQLMETKTSALNRYEGNNGHGEYLFEDVLIDNLADYYVEFEYDGLTYTNVTPAITKDSGSKAAEKAKEEKDDSEFSRKDMSREEFNKNFSSIEGRTRDTGFTRDAKGNVKHDNLTYRINGHTAEFINQAQYTETKDVVTLTPQGKFFSITAQTRDAKFGLQNEYKRLGEGTEEIKYINLGLYKRAQPDIALDQDIENVRLTINGYEHTYLYKNRFLNAGEYGDGFNVGVKFGFENRYNTVTYSRPVYKSDINYENEEDRSKELKAYITYEIRMGNETPASSLYAQVNSLVDYFDSNYEIVNVGTKLDEKTGNPNGDIAHLEKEKLVGNISVSDYNNDYKKVIINTDKTDKIEPGKTKSIYVQFALNREAIKKALDEKDSLLNITEVNSYSTYDKNGQIYAGIDTDSNPGNTVPGDNNTYEDDNCKAPGLRLELAAERQITGKVFEDDVIPEEGQNANSIMTGKVRRGNGTYEDGETGIAGVEVTLTEHKENGEIGEVYTKKTDSDGNFTIKDYIPGEYTLTYTWGNETYTVQDYKSTIYQEQNRQNGLTWHIKEGIRYSDAMDNYNKPQDEPKGSRIQIDEEIREVTHKKATIKRHQMDATTPMMGMGIEKADADDTEDKDVKKGTTPSLTTITDGDIFVPEDYFVKDIDFGIVERAKQEMTLNKRVETLKVTLANGNVIVDLQIDENGNVTGEKNSITYMKPDPNITPSNGFIRLELDNELIQGTTLEVGYVITATNNSELDYLSEKFYHYGIVEGKPITMTPTSIIDYLDKDWFFNEKNNPDWEIKTKEQLQTEDLVSAEVIGSNIGEKWILYTEKLKDNELEPAIKDGLEIKNKQQSQAEVTLNVSKVLSTTDEISLDNETEIIKINRPGGRKPEPIPGNYVPGGASHEVDDSMAETTIVTPATGENQNYIVPIVLGTTVLLILGAGVVIIKKKVL